MNLVQSSCIGPQQNNTVHCQTQTSILGAALSVSGCRASILERQRDKRLCLPSLGSLAATLSCLAEGSGSPVAMLGRCVPVLSLAAGRPPCHRAAPGPAPLGIYIWTWCCVSE